MVKGSSPWAPLDEWGAPPTGPNSRSAGEDSHGTFYGPWFALALSTLRLKKMSWWEARRREHLYAIDHLEIELPRGGGSKRPIDFLRLETGCARNRSGKSDVPGMRSQV